MCYILIYYSINNTCAIFLPIAVKLGFRTDKLVAILIMLGSATTVSIVFRFVAGFAAEVEVREIAFAGAAESRGPLFFPTDHAPAAPPSRRAHSGR